MKIMMIGDANSIHFRRWCSWFATRGHAVHAVSVTHLAAPESSYVVTDLTRPSDLPVIKWLIWLLRLRKMLRREQPDILHAQQVTGGGWLGAASGYHPWMVSAWGSDLYIYPHRSPLNAILTRFVLRRADQLLANSAHLCQQAVQWGAAQQRVSQVSWGLDKNIFFPTDEPYERAADAQPDEPYTIISLRACTPIYNQHLILAAFAQLNSHFPNAKLILLAYNQDAAYRQQLNQIITQLGLENQVIWVESLASDQAFAALLRGADLAVSFPSSDSSSLAVLEALACGVPVIASDLPALHELIQPGESGLLVPVGNPDTLAEAMLALLNNSALRHKLRVENASRFARYPDRDEEFTRAEAIYVTLFEEHQR